MRRKEARRKILRISKRLEREFSAVNGMGVTAFVEHGEENSDGFLKTMEKIPDFDFRSSKSDEE